MQKTRLEQFRVDSVDNALRQFTRKTAPTVIPIVLTPAPRRPWSCYMSIPTGPHCILHRWGEDKAYHRREENDSLASPGLTCTPACNRVAYCVSAQAVTYDAPVKSCPTADNVMVDCDLTLVFTIGPAPRMVKEFVYKLGARRFDEMLEAAVQEAIRHLIRTCPHTDIYELRGGSSDKVRKTLDELNKKFERFGVSFNSAAITEVRFSPELQASLQNTTEFASKMKEEEKRQQNELDKIKFRKNRELTDLERQHARIIQDLQAKRTRVEINRTELKTRIQGEKGVRITQEKQKSKVNEAKCESEKKVARNQGLTSKEMKVSNARAHDKSMRIKIDAECKANIYKAEQSLEASKDLVLALKAQANVEEKVSSMLVEKRIYDLRMAKLEALSHIAARNKIVISGENGDNLLGDLLNKEILGKIQFE